MDYKTRFRPIERLGRDGWRRMGETPETAAAEPTIPFRTERRRLFIDV
jgi:leucyl-tRNA---protein transferase